MDQIAFLFILVALFIAIVLITTRPLWGVIRHFEQFEGFITIDEAVKFLRNDIINAHETIKIVTGRLPKEIYDPVADALIAKIESSKQVQVYLLTGPKREGMSKKWLDLAATHPEQVHIVHLPVAPLQHFRVVDGTTLLAENPHGGIEPGQHVKYTRPSLFNAPRFEKEFDDTWRRMSQ